MRRLEEIKHEYDFLGVIHRSEHIEWLIEQAERYDECRLDAMKLYEENQRYREAIEKIKNKVSQQLEGLDAEEEMERVIKLSELMSISIEALEGEE